MDIVCASLAFIDGLGAPEMVLIFVVILVLFGGQKLPEFARGLGKTMREFKKAAAGVEEEFKRALEEDERKNATPALPPATTASHGTTSAVADPGGPDAATHPVTYDEITGEPIYADDTPAETHPPATQETEPKILPPAGATETAPSSANASPPTAPAPATAPATPVAPAAPGAPVATTPGAPGSPAVSPPAAPAAAVPSNPS